MTRTTYAAMAVAGPVFQLEIVDEGKRLYDGKERNFAASCPCPCLCPRMGNFVISAAPYATLLALAAVVRACE